MAKQLRFTKQQYNGVYNVEQCTGMLVGTLECIEGGYLYFFPQRSGYWPAYALREIADKLDELNAEWDALVKESFDQQASDEVP